MTPVSRRGFVAGAVAIPLLGGLAGPFALAHDAPLLLHDATLRAGRRFAAQANAMGGMAFPLTGDRVRQIRAMLRHRPAEIFGVTRHADQLLIEEIAHESGYRRVALVQHRGGGVSVGQCRDGGDAIGRIARSAGSRWPEAFAELALKGVQDCPIAARPGTPDPALSWVLARRFAKV